MLIQLDDGEWRWGSNKYPFVLTLWIPDAVP